MFNLKPRICQPKLKKEKSHLLLMRPISSVRINKCNKDIPWKQQTKESISVIRVECISNMRQVEIKRDVW